MLDLYEHWDVDSPEIREFLARRYIERVIGCIENVTNRNCTLSSKEKKAEIKKMISSEQAREAVKTAKELTREGGVCLLSPAAASYGFFKNFEERGKAFKELVKQGG